MRFRIYKREAVPYVCRRLKDLPERIDNLLIDKKEMSELLANCTTIELMQITCALYHTNLKRKINGKHVKLVIPKKSDSDFPIPVKNTAGHSIAGYTHERLQAMASRQACANTAITRELKSLSYISSKIKGSCHALATLSIKAFLSGHLSDYIAHTHALSCIPLYQFPDFFKELEELIGRYQQLIKTAITDTSQTHLMTIYQKRLDLLIAFHADILAFLFTTSLNQDLKHHQWIFVDADGKRAEDALEKLYSIYQHCSATSMWLASIDVPDELQPTAFGEIVDIYTSNIYAAELEIIAHYIAQDFSISLTFNNHEMALHFDATNQQWFLQDPNYLPGRLFANTRDGRQNLAAQIFIQNKAPVSNPINIISRLRCCKSHEHEMKKSFEDIDAHIAQYRKTYTPLTRIRQIIDCFGYGFLEFSLIYAHNPLTIEKTFEKAVALSMDFSTQTRTNGYTILHVASSLGINHLVDQLLARKVDINCKTNCGFTPLRLAAEGGHEEVVKKLLAAGANTSIKDQRDYTALQIAYYYERWPIVELLHLYATAKKRETSMRTHTKMAAKLLAVGPVISSKRRVTPKRHGVTPQIDASVKKGCNPYSCVIS
ncbi:MAG: ankyrin repeat domain-containing protein [Coxiellaceae bacterium]|nr:ankyrin repeat domain-containing protein [Coxiellaceae bacterium]